MSKQVPSVAEGITFHFECDKCGEKAEETVARLLHVNEVPCRICGRSINLKAPNVRLRFKELADDCARLSAALREAGNK